MTKRSAWVPVNTGMSIGILTEYGLFKRTPVRRKETLLELQGNKFNFQPELVLHILQLLLAVSLKFFPRDL